MQDDYTAGSPEPNYPPAGSSFGYRTVPDPPPRRPQATSNRLPWMVFLLSVLVALIVAPPIVERIRYAYVYGQQKAEVDAATEGLAKLDELNLEGVSTAFRFVAKKVGPSVVHINTRTVNGNGQPDEWAQMFGFPGRQEARGQGSGVIVDADGYVVTNNHVIAGATEVVVKLTDSTRALPARVIGSDPLTDIAVLKIDADRLIAAPWGDSDRLEVGDMVWAVGSPFGLDSTVTFGILSAKGRRGITTSAYQDFLQSDAAVNPGNSGGPLVNIHGEIIGINTAIVGKGFQGVSFAIPSSIAKDVYERIRQTGKVARGWLGVALEELTPELAKRLELKEVRGVFVRDVVANSPAARGGIQKGDIVIEWNGVAVNDPTALSRLVAAAAIGSKGHVTILRNGEKLKLHILVDERPAQLD